MRSPKSVPFFFLKVSTVSTKYVFRTFWDLSGGGRSGFYKKLCTRVLLQNAVHDKKIQKLGHQASNLHFVGETLNMGSLNLGETPPAWKPLENFLKGQLLESDGNPKVVFICVRQMLWPGPGKWTKKLEWNSQKPFNRKAWFLLQPVFHYKMVMQMYFVVTHIVFWPTTTTPKAFCSRGVGSDSSSML